MTDGKLKVAIVEDEEAFAAQLAGYLEDYGKSRGLRIESVCFRDGEDITEHYAADYDLVLLDIQMRFMNGLEAARFIRERDSRAEIMFITGIAEFAIEGYKVRALDYVMKPLNYETFSLKMDRALLYIRDEEGDYLTIRVADGSRRIDVRDIIYIESEGHRLHFVTGNETISSSGSIGELEERLLGAGFFRCNKGILVNMKEVSSIVGYDCVAGGRKIPVSRRKRAEFIRLLTEVI